MYLGECLYQDKFEKTLVLYQCLNAGRLTPFPWKATSTTLTCGMGKRDEIEVNCYCRMPSLKDMDVVCAFQKVHSLCDDLATSYSYRQRLHGCVETVDLYRASYN